MMLIVLGFLAGLLAVVGIYFLVKIKSIATSFISLVLFSNIWLISVMFALTRLANYAFTEPHHVHSFKSFWLSCIVGSVLTFVCLAYKDARKST